MTARNRFLEIANLPVEDFAADGKCISRQDGQVIFTKFTHPGDVVQVKARKTRKRYLEGVVTAFEQLARDRVQPRCEHFGACGGCQWQHVAYVNQLTFKRQQVLDQLQRIGGFEHPEVKSVLASPQTFGYRNKLEYTFSSKRWLTPDEIERETENLSRNALGFHKPGMFNRILDINSCWLMDPIHNDIRNRIREFTLQKGYSFFNQETNTGFLRNLLIRKTNLNQWLVMLQVGEPDETKIENILTFIRSTFPFINSIQYVVNTKKNDTYFDLDIAVFHGPDMIMEELGGLKFHIGPKTFFQTNSLQAEQLYQKIADHLVDAPSATVYDLYTGTGTIALYISARVGSVVGIESIPESVEAANHNKNLNNIENVTFYPGDVKDVFNVRLVAKHGDPDVVIVDPPRAGLHPDVITNILDMKPLKLIYVSCNPGTQARDLSLLSNRYTITELQPVDMFPHTHHVENIAVLKIKS